MKVQTDVKGGGLLGGLGVLIVVGIGINLGGGGCHNSCQHSC